MINFNNKFIAIDDFTLKNILLYFFVPYIILNIITLPIFPLPWLDEVFFADITQSLAQTGKYTLHNQGYANEDLTYGPLYFNLQVLITDLFGFGTFQFRLLGFISGILTILVAIKILQYLKVASRYQALYLLLICFQEVFFRGLHFGRMDLVATLPVMVSFYLYLKFQNSNTKFHLLVSRIAITILLSCACLTTPRAIFLLLPFGILFVIDFYNHRENYFYHTLNFSIISGVIISYLIWILYKFSSIDIFLLSVYKSDNVQAHFMEFRRLKRFGAQTYIYILPSLFAIFFGGFTFFKLRGENTMNSSFLLFIFASIVSYFIIVAEPQPYTAMLFPFIYLAIMYLLSLSHFLSPIYNNIQILFIRLILLVNIAAFFVRIAGLALSYEGRNADISDQFIKKHIENGSNVIADYKYFYSLHKNNNTFNFLSRKKEIIQKQESLFNYDYLLIEDSLRVKYYRTETSDLVLVTKISIGRDLSNLSKKLSFLGSKVLFATYDGYLYKRIRKKVPIK